jgi:hypothetical protein
MAHMAFVVIHRSRPSCQDLPSVIITESLNLAKAPQEEGSENLLIIRLWAPAEKSTECREVRRQDSQSYVYRGYVCHVGAGGQVRIDSAETLAVDPIGMAGGIRHGL